MEIKNGKNIENINSNISKMFEMIIALGQKKKPQEATPEQKEENESKEVQEDKVIDDDDIGSNMEDL